MTAPVERPATDRAVRLRIWGSIALVIIGLGMAAFTAWALHAVITECDGLPESECRSSSGRGLGLLVVIPPAALWYGLVVLPREARLLRRPGRRLELTPYFALQHERAWMLRVLPITDVVKRCWLVAEVDGATIAIPVTEEVATRSLPSTAALVRGRLRPSSHVMLDFPHEVIAPMGAVRPLPPDATTDVEPTNEPQWPKLLRWQHRARMAIAGAVALLGLALLPGNVESRGASCGWLPGALASDASDGCTGEAAQEVGAAGALIATGAALAYFTDRRRPSRVSGERRLRTNQ